MPAVFRRWLKSIELWGIVLLAALAAGLFLNWRWLRGPDEWRWNRYPLPDITGRLWLSIFVLLAVIVAGYWWSKQRRTDPREQLYTYLFLFLASLSVQGAILYLEHPQPLVTLFYRTVSPTSGGYFNVATGQEDMKTLLRHFPEEMPHLNAIHPRTHPPGLLLLFWTTEQMLARWPSLAGPLGTALRLPVCDQPALMALPNHVLATALLQMTVPLWAALTTLFVYRLACRLSDEHTAGQAVLLFIFIPSIVLWATRWNQFYTFLSAVALYLVHQGVAGRRWFPFAVVGLLLSLATFLSLSNLALIFVVLAYAAAYWLIAESNRSYRLLLKQAFAFLLGLITIWLIYFLLFDVTFWQIYRSGMAVHGEINRSYPLWLFYNLYDFFLFLGIPLFLLLLSSLARIAALWFSPKTQPADSPATLPLVPLLAFWLILLTLNFSGAVRGEVARLWMFLLPLALLAALPALTSRPANRTMSLVMLQAGQLLLMGYFLRPVGTGFPYYQPRPANQTIPAIAHELQATLGVEQPISLLGYNLNTQSTANGYTLHLTLFWRAEKPISIPYTVFVHLVDDNNQLLAQHDGMPQQGARPTTCWLPGEIISDDHHVPLPPSTITGNPTLYVGLYNLDSLLAGDPHSRLPVMQNRQLRDNVELGRVVLPE